MEKQSFFKVTAIKVREIPRRSKRLAMLQNFNTAIHNELESSFQQSDQRAQHSEGNNNTQKKQSALAMLQNFNTAHPA
ncbi:hypothetical protein CXK86_18670 [Paenibacillus sp. BGI2013]|uniref:hypothetical protein n=1 Tax=Paenibacillus TaxID=44249 RepID=UPI00096CA456|nr:MULTISPECIES: hypothetical protein [Paenibacillus]OMF41566.1 hypothetical protein BK136_20280 [Paenibacillus amylolyticus]PKQ89618.1 hypothetical protein CXK86_18670 [Paenibacillus sp. BGI2013]